MNIILLGYRGCGKTSIGRKLATQLWKTFVDIDSEICKRFNNKTVAVIWQEFGEPRYRQVEVEVTQLYCGKPDQIIALGGGTLMQEGARMAVTDCQKAVRIYLKCDAKELHKRISGDSANAGLRPNLTKLGGGLEEIVEMLKVRGPVYEAVADKTVDVTHMGIDDAVRYLVSKVL